ncbi:MAG: hypothetical protein VYC34_06820 [Planctomycetota bacterium]|nr:hypothetical protein [Planctomycetota bacterium]
MNRLAGGVIAGLMFVAGSAAARADTVTWITQGSGVYGNGMNWSTGALPTNADRARFDIDNFYTVSFNGNASAGQLELKRGEVTLDFGGFTYSLVDPVTSLRMAFLTGDVGILRLRNGMLSTQTGTIGNFGGSSGLVDISGASAQWNNANAMIVGSSGIAELNISQGADVNFGTSCGVGIGAGATADIIVTGTGSTLTGSGPLTIGEEIGAANAMVTADSGGRVIVNDIQIRRNGIIGGGSTFQGNVTNSGFVSPGSQFGQMTIQGNLIQNDDGQVFIELNNTASFDRLVVTGTATLGGSLGVQRTAGFVPPVGQTFTILQAGSIVGTFDTNLLPGLPGDAQFRVEYTPTTVLLRVIEPVFADLTGDGFVNAADLATLLAVWGQDFPPADFNEDGVVNAADLATLLAEWTPSG